MGQARRRTWTLRQLAQSLRRIYPPTYDEDSKSTAGRLFQYSGVGHLPIRIYPLTGKDVAQIKAPRLTRGERERTGGSSEHTPAFADPQPKCEMRLCPSRGMLLNPGPSAAKRA